MKMLKIALYVFFAVGSFAVSANATQAEKADASLAAVSKAIRYELGMNKAVVFTVNNPDFTKDRTFSKSGSEQVAVGGWQHEMKQTPDQAMAIEYIRTELGEGAVCNRDAVLSGLREIVATSVTLDVSSLSAEQLKCLGL